MLTEQLTVNYVCRYVVERCYGGPEEGGWWYDHHDFDGIEQVIVGHPDLAYAVARSLNESTDNSGPYHRDRFDVNGDADLVYFVDEVPGEGQTEERPYYC